jgi:alpha-tubulin suppressor-like RCC1 family protein
MSRRGSPAVFRMAALLAMAAACGQGTTTRGGGPDAEPDSERPEASSEGPDAESAPDATIGDASIATDADAADSTDASSSMDAPQTAAGEAGLDALADVVADAPLDTPHDAMVDTGSDTGPDAGGASSGDSGAEAGEAGPDALCIADVTSIDNGAEYSCAVRSDSTLWCWGRNDYGQVGTGSSSAEVTSPQPISWPQPIQSVATGIDSACALTTNGAVLCWGRNEFGEVGNGTQARQPTPVVTIASGMTALGIGYTQHMCAIASDGSLWCWGSDVTGESGGTGGASGNVLSPQQVAGLPLKVIAVSVGDQDTCAVTNDTALWCWGENSSGQLGYATGGTGRSTAPQKVTAIGTGVVKVAVGFAQTCAVKSDGTLWCWGDNAYAELGLPDAGAGTGTPTQVVAAGNMVVDVSAAENTCIRKSDGTVWCWGNNSEDQNGYVSTTSYVSTPTQVPDVATATAVVSGVWNSCVIASSKMECWGTNGYGELGIGYYSGTTTTATEPLIPCP